MAQKEFAESNHQFSNPFYDHGASNQEQNNEFLNTSNLFSSMESLTSEPPIPYSNLAGQRHESAKSRVNTSSLAGQRQDSANREGAKACENTSELSAKLDSIQIAMESLIKRERESNEQWKSVVNALVHEEVSRLVPEIIRSQSHQCESSPIRTSQHVTTPPPPVPQTMNPFLPNYMVPVVSDHMVNPVTEQQNREHPKLAPNITSTATCKTMGSDIPKLSKPVTELPTFDGSSDLAMFRIMFEECATLNRWEGEMVKSIWLKQCLRGAARDAVLFEKVTSTDHIFQILDSRYGSKVLVQKYDAILDHRKKKPNESMSELANDIRKMVEVVYCDSDRKTRERMSIKYFIKAIPNINARYELTSSGLTVLEQVVERAAIREVFYSQYTPFRANTESSSPSPQVAKAATNQRSMTDQTSDTPTTAENNRNYNNQRQQNRRKCKHCGQNHPAFVCQPCRHCGGPHYDNQCPGNFNPIPQQSARQ